MKVILAGGREFTNYDFVEKECNSILKNLAEPIEIVSGLARGVDTLAINYQMKYGYKLHPFPI
jgi:predicted Rossmann fold nucleotide-binding protein DprA/Smf involved in DNA uptake